jgi:transposase
VGARETAMRVIDWEAVEKVAKELCHTPMTIKQIARLGKITDRTAYRWLDLIQESGADLVRRSKKGKSETYQILGEVELSA